VNNVGRLLQTVNLAFKRGDWEVCQKESRPMLSMITCAVKWFSKISNGMGCYTMSVMYKIRLADFKNLTFGYVSLILFFLCPHCKLVLSSECQTELSRCSGWGALHMRFSLQQRAILEVYLCVVRCLLHYVDC
jgi:hypothetical protein